jgi:hypothetical protein
MLTPTDGHSSGSSTCLPNDDNHHYDYNEAEESQDYEMDYSMMPPTQDVRGFLASPVRMSTGRYNLWSTPERCQHSGKLSTGSGSGSSSGGLTSGGRGSGGHYSVVSQHSVTQGGGDAGVAATSSAATSSVALSTTTTTTTTSSSARPNTTTTNSSYCTSSATCPNATGTNSGIANPPTRPNAMGPNSLLMTLLMKNMMKMC